MTILNTLPFFPLYYGGKTKFTPINCSDLTEIIYQTINQDLKPIVIECIGPEVMTFRNLIERLLILIDKKRILLSMPLLFASISAKIFQLLPKPLLTEDQLRLLKYDNVLSGKYKSNFDIGSPSKKYFDEEVKKYSYMWREGGQFSTEKYNQKKNIDN